MDRLDALSIASIAILSILCTAMITVHRMPSAAHSNYDMGSLPGLSPQSQTAQAPPAQNIYAGVEGLIKAAHYEEALEALKKIVEKHPRKPESQIYLAVIYNRQGDMEKAISLCRQSIEKNPDLQDLATADLTDLVQKGIPKLKREKELKPNDEKVSKLLRDLYFCQRKLGQGCE